MLVFKPLRLMLAVKLNEISRVELKVYLIGQFWNRVAEFFMILAPAGICDERLLIPLFKEHRIKNSIDELFWNN